METAKTPVMAVITQHGDITRRIVELERENEMLKTRIQLLETQLKYYTDAEAAKVELQKQREEAEIQEQLRQEEAKIQEQLRQEENKQQKIREASLDEFGKEKYYFNYYSFDCTWKEYFENPPRLQLQSMMLQKFSRISTELKKKYYLATRTSKETERDERDKKVSNGIWFWW